MVRGLRLLAIILAFICLFAVVLRLEAMRDFYATQILVHNADSVRRLIEEVKRGGESFSMVSTIYVPDNGLILLDNFSVKALYKGFIVYNVKIRFKSLIGKIESGYHTVEVTKKGALDDLPLVILKR